MQAYLGRTSSELYRHSDLVCPFQHIFLSQVPSRATGYHFPIGAQTCSRWMHTVMTRVSIDLKYKGGSTRMAAASAAIDRGVPIDVGRGPPHELKGRDTRQLWPSQPTQYSLGMTIVASIVWWLLQSVDFDYQYLHGRRLQASSQDDKLRGVADRSGF